MRLRERERMYNFREKRQRLKIEHVYDAQSAIMYNPTLIDDTRLYIFQQQDWPKGSKVKVS
jgi:hypothetical protein